MTWNTHSKESRANGGFSFSALVLVGLGGVFLANNFGLLPWEIWSNLWKFWPVLLILFGLETLIGRNSSPKGLLVLLGMIFLLPVFLILNPLTGNPLAASNQTFNAPLGNLSRGKFVFEMPTANIKVSSLEASSGELFNGQVKYTNLLPKPEMKNENQVGTGVYTFTQNSQKALPFLSTLGNTVEFKLSTLVPHEIKTQTNSGTINLDLKNLKVTFAEINNATGLVEINFAEDFSNKVFIKTTSANIKLNLPQKVAAQVKTDEGVEKVTFDDKRFKKTKNTYTSIDFEVAQYNVEVEISGKPQTVEIKHS